MLPKTYIAKVISSMLGEGCGYVTAQTLSSRIDPETIPSFLSEARGLRFVTGNGLIDTTYGNGAYFASLSEASLRPGQKVVVVKHGKTYTGVVSDTPNGRYKLAFDDEKPDDHDDDSEYSELDFGTVETDDQ